MPLRPDAPATVTIERGAQRLRCKVVDWSDSHVECEPLRASLDAVAFLVPRSAVNVSWSTDTALWVAPGTITARNDATRVTVAFTGERRALQRRDRVRARCVFPVEVAVAAPEGVRIVHGETIDLSATGVGLRAPLTDCVGRSVVVRIRARDEELPLLAGRIVGVVEETSRAGIAFGSVLPGTQDRVANLVARLLANRVIK